MFLRSYDIGGFCVLHSPGFSEYLNHVSPSYSGLTVVNGGFRLKAKADELGSVEARNKVLQDSYNMVVHISQSLCTHAVAYMELEKMLTKQLDGKKFPGSGSDHIEQNN